MTCYVRSTSVSALQSDSWIDIQKPRPPLHPKAGEEYLLWGRRLTCPNGLYTQDGYIVDATALPLQQGEKNGAGWGEVEKKRGGEWETGSACVYACGNNVGLPEGNSLLFRVFAFVLHRKEKRALQKEFCAMTEGHLSSYNTCQLKYWFWTPKAHKTFYPVKFSTKNSCGPATGRVIVDVIPRQDQARLMYCPPTFCSLGMAKPLFTASPA